MTRDNLNGMPKRSEGPALREMELKAESGSANGAGTSLTNDILGNRTALGSSTSYGWDCLNRMTSFNGGTATSYVYRADGMRVTRAQGSNTDRFRYDGQMPMETVQAVGTAQTIENGLGARGIDWTAVTAGSNTSILFPVYDAHGSQVATVARSGSNYTLANQRSFGAWGEIRQGATTGSPNGRYCGVLGHVQDDESGLLYMRARYYEPGSGRFVSEDSAMNGSNWYVYCDNCPTDLADYSGLDGEEAGGFPFLALLHAAAAAVGEILGDYAAELFWKNTFALTHSQRGIELVEKLHDNIFVKVVHGGIGAVLGFCLEYFLIPAAVASTIARAGTVGLAFAIGFFVGFVVGFEAQDILAMIGDDL